MAFNFGGQAGGQPNPAFGFSTPQTQSGFQFGPSNPTFGLGGAAQPATTAASAFTFGSGGNVSFGGGTSVFGAPTATSVPTSTFGSFGAPATGTTGGGSFSFAPAAPAFGTSGGGTFGTPATSTATSTPSSFFSGGGGTFNFANTGTAAPAPAAPQFGASVAAPAPAGQPFSFSTPPTSTPNIFGGTGFSLGGAPAPASTAPSLLSGGTANFNFGGFGTGAGAPPVPAAAATNTTASGFQATGLAPTMPTMLAPPTSAPAPTPFGTTPSALNLDASQGAQVPPFGGAQTSLPSLFSGGLGTTTAAVAPTFKPASTTAPNTGFGILPTFSVAPATTAPSLTFGTPAITKISLTGTATPTKTVTTATPSALSFGNLAPATASVAPLASVPVSAISTAAPTFSLGTSSLFTAPKPPTTTSMAGPAVPATTVAGVGVLPTTSIATVVPITTTASISTAAVAPPSGAPPAFSIGLPTLLTSTSTSPTVTATSTDTAVVGTAPGTQMTFRQLEESINKWNLELGDQERIFLNQATQVNAWDRLLISNGLKIKDLHESVERVKLEQERLDHELDFIVSQQRELEDLLGPLEKALDDTPALSIQQHADLQREHTYHLAEKVDCQLKRMAEDIKQIIEHLNTSQNQDETDPMQQVSKILNAHMDALQWVDQNTELLQKKLEEISKVMDSTKKDQESSWRISYN